MGAATAVAVIGSALLLIIIVSAVALTHRVLRHGGDLEVEIKAPSLSLHIKAKRSTDQGAVPVPLAARASRAEALPPGDA